jgi:hypothetical protein
MVLCVAASAEQLLLVRLCRWARSEFPRFMRLFLIEAEFFGKLLLWRDPASPKPSGFCGAE